MKKSSGSAKKKVLRRTTREIAAGFGPAVKAERERQGYTLAELADAAGCSPGAVSDIEREVRAVSLALAARIARALDAWPDLSRFAVSQ